MKKESLAIRGEGEEKGEGRRGEGRGGEERILGQEAGEDYCFLGLQPLHEQREQEVEPGRG
jgi:hypothetical protein